MRLLISMVFAGVLASSNNAFASENSLFPPLTPSGRTVEDFLREPTEQELIESKKKMDEEISKGKKAELILLKGNVITSRWLEDTHHTRVIYKGT